MESKFGKQIINANVFTKQFSEINISFYKNISNFNNNEFLNINFKIQYQRYQKISYICICTRVFFTKVFVYYNYILNTRTISSIIL